MKKLLAGSALLLFALLAAAGARAAQTPAVQSLEFGAGARGAAMAGAYSAVTDDANSLYWNPAGLARLAGHELTFMHAAHVESTSYDFGAYAQRIGRSGGFGGALQYFSYGSLPELNETGDQTGSFKPNDAAAALGYGYRVQSDAWPGFLHGVALGVSGKFIRSQIATSRTTFAGDVGALTPGYFDDKLRFSAGGQNLGARFKSATGEDQLPATARLGAAFADKESGWTLAAELATSPRAKPAASLGTEYALQPTDAWRFAVRAGVNSRTFTDIGGIAGFAMGIGVSGKRMTVDYALVPMGSLGVSNQISAGFFF